MSAAEPMDLVRRADIYTRSRRVAWGFTPRQARRWWHKACRAERGACQPVEGGQPDAERPKGRPTPRRAEARAARLERRRG